MQTNVSTLLREFPKVKCAALRGERVVIKTREGNLVLSAEPPLDRNFLGSMKGTFSETNADLSVPTLTDKAWKPSQFIGRRADRNVRAPYNACSTAAHTGAPHWQNAGRID
jgi:hypothetical protein